jgi:hypothetical protein
MLLPYDFIDLPPTDYAGAISNNNVFKERLQKTRRHYGNLKVKKSQGKFQNEAG